MSFVQSPDGGSGRNTVRRFNLQQWKRPPTLAEVKKSATIQNDTRELKGRGVIMTSPPEEIQEFPATMSDATIIASMREERRTKTLMPHVVAQSGPPVPGFPHVHGNSRSTDDLASSNTSKESLDSSSSDDDEEGEMIGECFICLSPFDEEVPRKMPRNLICGHAFCTGCLEQILLRSAHMTEIDCPLCHSITSVEGQTVANLAKNYPLMNVIRTLDSMGRKGRKISRKEIDHHASQHASQPPQCPEHNDTLRSYCLKDKMLVCSSCVLYGEHRNHPTEFLGEAAAKERKRLKELSCDVFKQKLKMQVVVTRVEDTCKQVQETGGRMEDEVDDYYQGLVDLVEEKRREGKKDIRYRTQLRVKALKEQALDLKETITRAEAVNMEADSLLRRGVDDYSLLTGAMLTLDKIEGLFTNPPPLIPKARNDLQCSFASDIIESMADSLSRSTTLVPEIVTVDASKIKVDAFHDGFRISWDEQNFADNTAISYHLQAKCPADENYINVYRGPAPKCTWKADFHGNTIYKFRLRVRTTEGVGNWSEPKEAKRAEPSMHWHSKWRSVKVDLSPNHLEASWLGGSSHNWASFAVDRLFEKRSQHYVELEILSLGKQKSKDRLAIGVIGCQKIVPASIEWNSKVPVGEWKEGAMWSFLPMSGSLKSHAISGDRGIPYGEDLAIQVGDRIGVLVDLQVGKLMYFCNGTDLGVAFDDLEERPLLLVVSIREKVRVRLVFPPPPYHKRHVKLIKLQPSIN